MMHTIQQGCNNARFMQGITNKLDARMMEAVRQAVETADGVLIVVDCSQEPESVLPMVQSAPGEAPPIAVVRKNASLPTDARKGGVV